MPCSVVQTARRELVKVLLALASAYSVALALKQDAADAQDSSAFRSVAKAVHTDKGEKVYHVPLYQEGQDGGLVQDSPTPTWQADHRDQEFAPEFGEWALFGSL